MTGIHQHVPSPMSRPLALLHRYAGVDKVLGFVDRGRGNWVREVVCFCEVVTNCLAPTIMIF